jgi:hypothetical protein
MACFAMKKGFFQDLHLQMVCMIYISSLVERTLQFEFFVNTQNFGLRLKENILLEN